MLGPYSTVWLQEAPDSAMEHPESDELLSEVPATEESKSEPIEPLRKR